MKKEKWAIKLFKLLWQKRASLLKKLFKDLWSELMTAALIMLTFATAVIIASWFSGAPVGFFPTVIILGIDIALCTYLFHSICEPFGGIWNTIRIIRRNIKQQKGLS